MTLYSQEFYDRIYEGSNSSASVIVPLVAQYLSTRSVCDVGCGTGAWLRAFKQHGTEHIVGMDGDYVDVSKLLIPRECFRPTDLTQPLPQGERFDLVISLEVAEHLPESCAQQFVRDLTQLSDCVLFSAAIPRQGGTGHVNEQWQSYWARLFDAEGFAVFDLIRPRVWYSSDVSPWYTQNTLVYTKDPDVQRRLQLATPLILDIVHPHRIL